MRLSAIFLSTALISCSAALAAVDPGLLALVPPDAQLASGVHVETSKVSPFGQYVLAHMQANATDLDKVIEETGFDPRRDVTEVLCASNGAQPQPSFLVLARGTFDPEKVKSAAIGKGATIQSYMGIDIILHEGDKRSAGVAFLDNTIAVVADSETLKYAIAHRTDSSGGTPKVSDALLTGINGVSNGNDAWFVSLVPGAKFFPQAMMNMGGDTTSQTGTQSPQGAALQSIQQSMGGVRFGDQISVNLQAVTRSDKDASSLADVVRFLTGMVQMQRQNNSQAAILAKALDGMSLQTNGSTMTVALSMPEKDFETLAQNGAHRRAAPAVQ